MQASWHWTGWLGNRRAELASALIQIRHKRTLTLEIEHCKRAGVDALIRCLRTRFFKLQASAGCPPANAERTLLSMNSVWRSLPV